MTPIVWTDEQANKLAALWNSEDKPSASEISEILLDECGIKVTASAVIGKAHRMKLPKRGNNSNYKGNGREKLVRKAGRQIAVRPKLGPSPEVVLRCVGIDPLHITLLDLEPHHCRYPYGEGPFTFCGHPVEGESSYCEAHADLCKGEGTPAERMAAPIQRNRHTMKASVRWGAHEAA